MARSRNIKPGFFKNELLAEVSTIGRLLFAGLWTIADREGRLEDRPKRIKADLLPYDECDIEDLLNQLTKHGFICRYAVENEQFIQVQNFAKHQNPHVKEQASTIPAPDLHQTCTMQEQNKHGSCHADSLLPITDSLIPGSDSGESVVASKTDNLRNQQSQKPNCPHQEIINLYHEILPASPRIKDWTAARAASLKARWDEDPERQTLVYWRGLFEYIVKSPFLTGKVSSPGRKSFLLTLDWLVKAENFAKVREGRYEGEVSV